MTARHSNIDIRGMLQNSLNVGVSSVHAISELLDNSLSAGSTDIRLTILEKESVLIISDDGCGMNKEALEKSGCLHSRTESSANRHGRFGFGGNQAQITLTNLEGSVISLSSDGTLLSDGKPDVSQLDTDFPKVMESGVYYPHAHDIATRAQPIWDEHAINRLGKGTVIHTHLSQPKRSELSELIKSDAVTGLRFMIGTTYRAQLENGVKISIKMNDVDYPIYPIDRLCSSVPVNESEYQSESHMIEIMQNKTTDEIVAHVLSHENRRCFNKSTKKLGSVSELSSDLQCVGKIKFTLAYSPNWNELQQPALEQNDITSLNKNQNGVIKFREVTNGTEIVRNGKVIVALPKPPKKGGDKAGIKYHDDTRSRIEFDANATMDDVFNIQVNKSKVNVDLIHPNIWKTIECLRNTFSDKCYKDSLQESTTDEEDEPQIVATPNDECESPTVAAVPDEEVEAVIVAAPSEEVEAVIVAAPSEEVEAAIVAAPSEEVEAVIVAAPSEEVEAVIVAAPSEEVEAAATVNALPLFVPDSIRPVRASLHPNVVRDKGEEILEMWKNSGEHVDEFKSVLDDLHIAYSCDCAAKTLQRYLNGMHFENKYYLLIALIRERHESPEDHMLKGVELLRRYNLVFGNDESD
jgi:hypothetical protein